MIINSLEYCFHQKIKHLQFEAAGLFKYVWTFSEHQATA